MTDYLELADEAEEKAERNLRRSGGYALYPREAYDSIQSLASALRELHAENHDLGVMYRCGIARIEQLEEELNRRGDAGN